METFITFLAWILLIGLFVGTPVICRIIANDRNVAEGRSPWNDIAD